MTEVNQIEPEVTEGEGGPQKGTGYENGEGSYEITDGYGWPISNNYISISNTIKTLAEQIYFVYNSAIMSELSTTDLVVFNLAQIGYSPTAIAMKLGLTPTTIRQKLKSPDFIAYLLENEESVDASIKTLYRDGAEALRRALNSESHSIALKAAELVFKVLGKIKPADNADNSVHLTVQKILQVVNAPPHDGAPCR